MVKRKHLPYRRRRKGFRVWLLRRASRRVKRRWREIKHRVKKAFEPKVVKSYKRDAWKSKFPDPRKPAPFTMTKVDPETREEYLATFDGELTLEFWVAHDSNVKLTDAAQEAAEQRHGPIAQSWVLSSIEGLNDPAREVLSIFPGGVLKP